MNKINNLEEYISIIKKLYHREGCGGVYKIYYRGQSNCNYGLMPSLGRKIEGYTDDEENYIPFEDIIIKRAKLEYPDIFRDNNMIDELALMQHYGLPTRLLDVTENPLVALYFACIKNKEYDGEVFVFNAGMNAEIYTSYDKKNMEKSNKIAFVRAKTFSNRQRAQQGLFMWFPNEKLRGIQKDIKSNNVISEIVTIPNENKISLLNELKMIGISSKSIFLDNVDLCCEELIRDITKDAYSA